MNTKYVVKFEFTKRLPPIVDAWAKNKFINMRNQACELFNPRYEDWNKEFDKLYPDIGGDNDKYIDFINAKRQPYLDEINKDNSGIKLVFNEDGAIDADVDIKNWKSHISLIIVPA